MTDLSEIDIPDDPSEADITYIAGPMTSVGPPTWNYPAFIKMADRLRAHDRKVISPHELHEPDSNVKWDWYLRRDLAQLVKCNGIIMLPGWGHSRGATLEHHVAKALEMTVYYPGAYAEIFGD
jgi:Domain of unknown function (DUF4406)